MNTSRSEVSRRLLALLGPTTAFEGVRAGAGTFRMILDLPARTQVGPVAFAEFSRATDLSTVGIAFYALYGVGGALLTGITGFVAHRTAAPVIIRRLLAAAFVASLAILAMTTQAAPLMWRVGSSPPDAELLGSLLNRFTLWTNLRIVCADISFVCVLASLTIAAWSAAPAPGQRAQA